jgi:hypothetical protein
VIATIFYPNSRSFELLNPEIFFAPRNRYCVVRHAGARAFIGIEDMHLEISQLNVHPFHAAPAALFIGRLDAPDNGGAKTCV